MSAPRIGTDSPGQDTYAAAGGLRGGEHIRLLVCVEVMDSDSIKTAHCHGRMFPAVYVPGSEMECHMMPSEICY